jgi:hypothetical protein
MDPALDLWGKRFAFSTRDKQDTYYPVANMVRWSSLPPVSLDVDLWRKGATVASLRAALTLMAFGSDNNL